MFQFFLRGDFRFFWLENIKDFASFPYAWDSSLNTGVGHSQLHALWIISYFNFTTFFTNLGLDWNLIQLIFWIIPAILIAFFSALLLFGYLFKNIRYSIISGIIYSLNTYFLMILTGGQLGVSLAYSLVPLILLRFMKALDKPTLRNSILAGLSLSLQLTFDPRIVYLTLVIILIHSLFNLSRIKKIKLNFFLSLILPVLLNFYWIFPLVMAKASPIPAGFDSAKSFEFFSFANFSNALSLLHPNFPENIFGKIYFLDPKFLILPVLAFSSLLFKKNKNILFFSLLALLGIFLAKGTNPPFGEVNKFLFENFPGMSIFRDPTKWYILIVLSYSMLIPFGLMNFSEWAKSRIKASKIFFLIFLFYFLFLAFPVLGQIQLRQVPNDYIQLKNFLVNEKDFFRTLWIPKWQRFGYFSNNHPAIGREELFKGNSKDQIRQLEKSEELLKDLSVKYVIVPYDSEGEMFLKDRKYNEKEYNDTISSLRRLSWLKEIRTFDKIKVFEISNPKDHFWSTSKDIRITYQLTNPTEYKVELRGAEKGDLLVFAEGFDRSWIAESSKFKVESSKFNNRLNGFILPQSGNYDLNVKYAPQDYVEAGIVLSLGSLIATFALLGFGKSLKKW